jgi:hypothetical protein
MMFTPITIIEVVDRYRGAKEKSGPKWEQEEKRLLNLEVIARLLVDEQA